MRVAYFSPLPPKRTGIATYSAHLARALAERADVDFFDAETREAPVPGGRVVDYVDQPEALLTLGDYDSVVYHLGNNPHFHLDIYRAFVSRPGIVVLHDTVLYFLFAGLGRGGMLREFLFNYGVERLAEFFAIERESPAGDVLRYRQPERYPFLRRVLDQAPGIIVHSETTANAVRGSGYQGDLRVIPHLAYPSMSAVIDAATRRKVRAEVGVEEGEFLIGCFGFIGPPKRFPVIFETLARLKSRLRFKLLIVGEGDDLKPEIAEWGLGDRTILPGFVEDARFQPLLKASDVLVNLRFPSMGEASGPLNQAMACGTPSIVSDHAWFAELPDEVVWKVAVGANESAELEQALVTLAENSDRRAELGEAARVYSQRHCTPDVVAARYLDFLTEVGRAMPADRSSDKVDDAAADPSSMAVTCPEQSAGAASPSSEEEWLHAYFEQRIQQAIGT